MEAKIAETNQQITKTNQRIAETKTDLIKWMFGVMIAQNGLIIGYFGFFNEILTTETL